MKLPPYPPGLGRGTKFNHIHLPPSSIAHLGLYSAKRTPPAPVEPTGPKGTFPPPCTGKFPCPL